MKYEEALKELEQIVSRMENNEVGIDEMTTQLKRAKQYAVTVSPKPMRK